MDLGTLIGNYGFPIVACVCLFYQQNKTMKDFSDKMEQNIKELSVAIQENTKATTVLVTTVETLEKVGDSNG